MSDDLRARYLPRFVDTAARRITRALEAVTPAGAGAPLVARTELHTLAGEAGILGLSELATVAHNAENEVRRWIDAGDVGARAKTALALRQLHRLLRQLADQHGLPAPGATATRRVLVVDDSELVAEQVCDGLRADGCEAMSASDVETTLRLVRELRPQIVLMDVNMPGLSLADLCAKAREAAGPARIAICLLSGVSEAELDAQAKLVGADTFVSKVAGLPSVVEHVKRIAAEMR
ncbi:MAG TPA: response regulator [Kofleriaceae bacterium]|nr:response regulator [Kofleriaceae bacterium]